MKKTTLRKVTTIVLALLMVLAMTTAAFAADDDTVTMDADGKVGEFTTPDTPVSQKKVLIIKKDLIAFNVDESIVMAPTVSYSYTITGATVTDGNNENFTVTDITSAHTSKESVTVPVKSGVGAPAFVDGTAVIAWNPTEELDADTDGASNVKDIIISFENVVFGAAGVYRYEITEKLTGGATYEASGVVEGDDSHTRYIDVYVRYAENAGDGTAASDWDIYGYTCFAVNESIDGTASGDYVGKSAGFVSYQRDTKASVSKSADQYYTFNVTIGKTVSGDNYAKNNHYFPFTVIMTNNTITTNVDIMGEVTGSAQGFTDPELGTIAAKGKGVAEIKDGGTVKYVGIPCGTAVEVYETNDLTGTVYRVTTDYANGTTTTTTVDASVSSGTKPENAAAQAATVPAYQSTKTTITTEAGVDDDNVYVIGITNTLETISPTGVILRYAPYLLVLIGGILLLGICWKLTRRSGKREEA